MEVKRIPDLISFRSGKMLKANLFESERMFCDLYCFEPGQEQALHDHEGNDKLYYVLQGSGLFTVGEETRPLEEGDATWAPSGELHGVKNHSGHRLVCLVFMAPHPQPEKFRSLPGS